VVTHVFAALLATGLSALPDAPVELRYGGLVEQVSPRGRTTPTKQFEIYCVVQRENDGGELAFVIDENGGGGWSWPERFGHIALDAQNRPTNRDRIHLLHEHEGLPHPVPIVQPVFEFADKLRAGAEWEVDGHAYRVLDTAERAGRQCWQVEVSGRVGRSHTIWVEKESSIVVAVEQRFFMGQGDQFRLTMELAELKPLDASAAERLQPVLAALKTLKADLQRKEGATDPDLSDEQLRATETALEGLARASEGTPLSKLVSTIARDVKSQSQRSQDVHSLAEKLVGRPAPELRLTALDGTEIPGSEREGKIVVLHFWKYHGEPLTEPYGQVGYLDFVNNRRQKLGVRIYGVAVDPRLAEKDSAQAAVRQIRKLREFMNLSYPVTLDDGSLVKAFGDPQRLGAKLPLWVVIDPAGNVAHYHAGYYDVQPREGLRELDEVLVMLLRKQRERKAN
jgi:peroxiredoxin